MIRSLSLIHILKRINRITFIKRRSVAEEAIIPGMGTGMVDELADYFYGEYGILSGQAEEPILPIINHLPDVYKRQA